jgi:mycothiol S-conjugate amidase
MYKDAGEPWRVEKLYYTAFPRSEMKRIVAMAKQAGMEPPFGEENPDNLAFLTPDEFVTTTIDCKSVVARKREALRAHRSQISPDWPQLTIPDEVAVQFADEFFQLVISRTPAVLPETDLFAGITPQA